MKDTVLVTFPGGKKVDAQLRGMTVHTDQDEADGGEGTAPTPFDYFLASLAACSGIVALSFCQRKGISTAGLALKMDTDWNSEGTRIERVTFRLTLPEHFPEDQRAAFQQRVEACLVKRHILNPPEFCTEIHTSPDAK